MTSACTDFDRSRLGGRRGEHANFQRVQAFPCIAIADLRQMPSRVGIHLDPILAEAAFGIIQGAVDQFLQLLDPQRLELKNLRARNQRAVHIEKWVVGRGPNEAQISALHIWQENVLLRFVEVMNLVDEQDGLLAGRSKPIRGSRHDSPHLGDIAFHSAEAFEFRAGHVRDDLRQRGFASAGRAGQDHGRQPIGFDCAPQKFSRREDVFLADKFLEGPRAHPGGEGRRWLTPGAFLSSLSKRSCTNKKYGAQIGLHIIFARMRRHFWLSFSVLLTLDFVGAESRLPFGTVFKGRDQFDRLVASARQENWKSLPIGERTATVGRALVGTRYKSYTLEIDNRMEAPSVNFTGMDCWTFYEICARFRADA